MIRQGDNFRMVDEETARAILSQRGLTMASGQIEQPRAPSFVSTARADAGYCFHQSELIARKAARLGILPSELPEYRRLKRNERFNRAEAVAIILRSRRVQA